MKRKYAAALAAALTLSVLSGCQAAPVKNSLTPVTLNEVAHSIFYAPQYAAIELGYFEEEGIDLTLVNGAGADKVMTALVSGDADIGFMGSEASIYTYAGGAEDYAVNFAQLTQRAGNFLVGHEADENFTWEKLKGKKVLGGRAGGVPYHDGYNIWQTKKPENHHHGSPVPISFVVMLMYYFAGVTEIIWGLTPSYQYKNPSISILSPIFRFFTAA